MLSQHLERPIDPQVLDLLTCGSQRSAVQEAPIFSVADFGLEADLFAAVPEFVQQV